MVKRQWCIGRAHGYLFTFVVFLLILFNSCLVASAGDVTAPQVLIIAPIEGSRVINRVVSVMGVAKDDELVVAVFVRTNNGDWTSATGKNNWQSNVLLVPGFNTIEVYALDSSGNRSITDIVHVTYVVVAPFSAEISGAGSITPDLNGQLLEIGKTYTITANPDPGYAFAGWQGSFTRTLSYVTFTMPPGGLSVRANFVPAFQYSNADSEITITNYIGPASDVAIPSTIGGLAVTRIAAFAFQNNSTITSVTIPAAVREIGQSAFIRCPNLASVTFGGSSLTLGGNCFDQCALLTRIFFQSNAPDSAGVDWFAGTPAVIYRLAGTSGWTSSLNSHPTYQWNPVIRVANQALDNSSGAFQFTASGESTAVAGIPIIVEASDDLSNPSWFSISTDVLSSEGTVSFTTSVPSGESSRVYRFRAQ